MIDVMRRNEFFIYLTTFNEHQCSVINKMAGLDAPLILIARG